MVFKHFGLISGNEVTNTWDAGAGDPYLCSPSLLAAAWHQLPHSPQHPIAPSPYLLPLWGFPGPLRLFLLCFLNYLFYYYYYLKPPGSVAGEDVINKRALFWGKKMEFGAFPFSPLSSPTPSV